MEIWQRTSNIWLSEIPVCHFELTATLIIINYLSQQLFFFPFPSTTYTKAYKYIWYPNSGASGFKFRFMWNSYTEGNIATYQAHRIWLRLPRFNTLSQMNPFLRLRHAKEIIGGEKQSLKNFTVSGKEMYDEVSKIQAGSFYIPLNSSYTMVLTRRICLEIRSLLKW